MPTSAKYKLIADQIIQDIKTNKLSLGQRLPSLRQLRKQQGISMTTALNSYRSLEERGWIVTSPKSGFFVSTPFDASDIPRLPQFLSSAKGISLEGQYSSLQAECVDGPFGISRLNPEYVPLTTLKRSIKRITQRGDDLLQSYANPQGLSSLRNAIAEHFGAQGFSLAENELCITSGCMDAIRISLLATSKPGDAIAVSSPCFDGLLDLLRSMQRQVVEIPCTSDGVDIQQLEAQFANDQVAAALFSSSHMNPHGISLSVEQKRSLAELANRYRMPIIEDDVYGELGFDNSFPLPIKHWDENGYVLWCSSISKTLASGLRIGWCSAGRYLNTCRSICVTESLGKNGLMQASLADFIAAGHYKRHLQSITRKILANTVAYRQLLLDRLPQGSAISAPRGGLVLWVQVPRLDDARLRELAAAAKLDLRLGGQFTSRRFYRDCFRINAGWGLDQMHDETRNIEQALIELAEIVHQAVKSK